MTELENMRRAKMYMDKLARGIDPITNQEMEYDTVLNNVRLARCFFYVSDILAQVIDNGGIVGSKPKKYPFSITREQLASVQVSKEPIRVTQLVDLITAAVNDSQMSKLSTTVITNWLLEKGFLEKQTSPEGKSLRIPTYNGIMLGITMQTRQGQYGEYQAVFYNTQAQRFVLDNLFAMLEEK
jgi:hypothetical protein